MIFRLAISFLIFSTMSPLRGEVGTPKGSVVAYYKFKEKRISLSRVYFGDEGYAKKFLHDCNKDHKFIDMLVRESRENSAFTGILFLRKMGEIPRPDTEFVREIFLFLDPPSKKQGREEEEKRGMYHLASSSILFCYSDIALIDYKTPHAWKLLPNPKKIRIPANHPR